MGGVYSMQNQSNAPGMEHPKSKPSMNLDPNQKMRNPNPSYDIDAIYESIFDEIIHLP